jgi:hypothetical protein
MSLPATGRLNGSVESTLRLPNRAMTMGTKIGLTSRQLCRRAGLAAVEDLLATRLHRHTQALA